MPRNATTALAALLVVGTASVVWADANNRTEYHGSVAQRAVSMTSNGRTGDVNEAAKSFITEEKASFATSQLAFGRDGTTGRTTAWIKLTEPSGKLIHINLEHVTSIRSDTQIPGARAQLDLTSGNFRACRKTSSRSCN